MHRTALRPVLALLLLPAALPAAPGELIPEDASLPPLLEREHRVSVLVRDGFSVTRLTQTFENHAGRDLEARWSVALPRGATVAGCSAWIDGREVKGEVVERARAEAIAASERAAGREAGTVARAERRFEVRIAPVRAGAAQQLSLVWYQPLEVDHGIGRYVYPLGAGGHGARAREVFLGAGAQRRARIEVEVRTSLPVEDLATPGWEGAKVEELPGADAATRRVVLEPPAGAALDQDFVLYWRHPQAATPRLSLLPYTPAEGDGYFQLVFDPGLDLTPELASRDWVLVLDVSSSMHGNKLAAMKEAACGLLRALPPGDRFAVVAFHSRPWEAFPQSVATPDRVDEAARAIGRLAANGSTDVLGALELATVLADPARTTGVVLISDGVVTAGSRDTAPLLRRLAERDVRVCTLAVGNEADLALLDRLSEESGGFHLDVSPQDLIEGRVLQARDKLARARLRGVQLQVEGGEVEDLHPAELLALHAGEPLVAFGRYRRPGPVVVRVRAFLGQEPVEWTGQAELPASAPGAPEVARMWALQRVGLLERDGRRREATEVALAHGLVTDRTSILLAGEATLAAHGIARTNAERLRVEAAAQAAPDHGRATPVEVRPPVEGVWYPGPGATPFDGPGSHKRRSSGWSGGGGGGAFGPLGALLALLALGRGRSSEPPRAGRRD